MYVFYDLETFGTNPAYDRISECAAVVTDDDFALVEDPTEIRCAPPLDYLPHPEACLVTGISPATAAEDGMDEPDFAAAVHEIVWREESANIVGYNNASFDDQFLRHLFYRNFHEPYLWERRNRTIDLLGLVSALFDFHRDDFAWPRDEDGRPSFRLERLVEANGLKAGTSHEALSDTFALRNLAKAIRERVPDVWAWLPKFGNKKALQRECQQAVAAQEPSGRLMVYSSPVLKQKNRSSTVVAPLLADPRSPGGNSWWALDLASNVSALLRLGEDEIAERIEAGPGEAGAADFWKPVVQLRLNRFPLLFPATEHALGQLDERGVSKVAVVSRAEELKESDFLARFRSALLRTPFPSGRGRADVDGDLYHSFPRDDDAKAREMLRSQSLEWLRYQRPLEGAPAFPRFHDSRYQELLWRFRARYLPATLTGQELRKWKAEARQRLTDPPNDRILGFEAFTREWRESRNLRTANGRLSETDRRVLAELMDHRNQVARWLELAEQKPLL